MNLQRAPFTRKSGGRQLGRWRCPVDNSAATPRTLRGSRMARTVRGVHGRCAARSRKVRGRHGSCAACRQGARERRIMRGTAGWCGSVRRAAARRREVSRGEPVGPAVYPIPSVDTSAERLPGWCRAIHGQLSGRRPGQPLFMVNVTSVWYSVQIIRTHVTLMLSNSGWPVRPPARSARRPNGAGMASPAANAGHHISGRLATHGWWSPPG